MRILITGGCGFIGSHLIRTVLQTFTDVEVVNLDLMTYAANPANVADFVDDPRYSFFQGDIADPSIVEQAMPGCTHVINVAAESHVDRSIQSGSQFITTDVLGPFIMMEAARKHGVERFVQVSTDEVYGSIGGTASFAEDAPLNPSSPYSASKAGGDLQALAYATTYDFPVIVTRGSNTYGTHQHPEKFIPLFTTNALEGKPLPLYGDGMQVRDWLHVQDHVAGIIYVLMEGAPGTVYNIGGGDERHNRDVAEQIVALTGADSGLITRVQDRAGHDIRYSISCDRLHALGWKPTQTFATGLADVVSWYTANTDWWEPIKRGSFREFYDAQYKERLASGSHTQGS